MQPSSVIAAVEFASPAMLGWTAAAALPWLINLWSRRRHVETPWAAVDLLMAAVRQRSRRLKLRQLLLLALRTTVLLLAALAASRPVWRDAASPGTGRTHHVLIVDRSLSMQCRVGDASRLELAKRQAADLIAAAPSGDAFTVIAWADDADDLLSGPTFDATAAGSAVASIQPLDAATDLRPALRAAGAAVQASRGYRDLASRVVFYSDLAASGWSELHPHDSNQGDAPRQWAQLRDQAELVVVNVDGAQPANVAITAIRAEPATPLIDQAATIAVELAAFGNADSHDAALELVVEGTRQHVRPTVLRSGENTVETFDLRFTRPGSHIVEVRLQARADPLEADNRRWLSLVALPATKVICFADERSEAVDVARAFDPRFADAAGAGPIAVEIAAAARLASTNLQQYNAVVLCNVAELPPRPQRLLQGYVAAGGALIIILGDRVRTEQYNELLSGAGGPGDASPAVLPVVLGAAPVAGDWRLDPRGYRHPVVAKFAGRASAGLLGVRVSRYLPIKVTSGAATLETPLAFTSGEPALVTGNYGEGRIALLAANVALETRGQPWSSLAVSPAFVPLMRELLAYVADARRQERLNRVAGQSLPEDADAAWRTPYGVWARGPIDTRHAGMYVKLNSRPQPVGEGNPPPLRVAVNIDPRESDLTPLDRRELPGGDLNGVAGETAQPGSYGGRPLDGYLLAGALALLPLELFVAWTFGRGNA
ncbi:MAG: hypothetical protein DCC67_11240 [Planctomycetota bacterium]|nr:MAG: hypothetical protein DCC67_11240 [Planctomycetota bacterium]